MKQEKINKFIKDMNLAKDLYHNTGINVSQIARLLKRSATTADHMITGKNLPKYLTTKTKKGG